MNLRIVVRPRVTMIGWALLVTAAAVFGCSPAAAPKPNIEHMLANAKTASDHEAIAHYYEGEAADAKAKYEEHKASAVHYERSVKWRTWSWHCDRLAQDFKGVEEDASALAAEHRKIAAEMKSGQTSAVSSPAAQSAKQSMKRVRH